MAYFPLFVSLEGLSCLVIGGGKVALRKVTTLRKFGAEVTVVAPGILPEIERVPGVKLIRRRFEEKDLENVSLIFAASSEEACNREAARLGRERRIPVNAADLPGDCDFFFPALVHRGDVVAGISTGGISPALAGRVRARIEEALPEDLAAFASEVGQMRQEIIKRGGCPGEDPGYRKKIEEYFAKNEDSQSGNEDKPACNETDRGGHSGRKKQGAGSGV